MAVNTKVTAELKQRLEAAAANHGRTVAAEIEDRLLRSFDDPLANAFKRNGAAYVRSEKAAADFFGAVAETFEAVVSVSRRKGLSEADTRSALRAALDRLKFFYLWIGEEPASYPAGYRRKSKTFHAEMPPGPMGHAMATSTAVWNAAWNDEMVPQDTSEGRIANHWSGDGSQVELKRQWDEAAHADIDDELRQGKPLEQIMAERGLKFEDPARLNDYESDGS